MQFFERGRERLYFRFSGVGGCMQDNKLDSLFCNVRLLVVNGLALLDVLGLSALQTPLVFA